MIIAEPFFPDTDAVRNHALARSFIDWQGHDGEVYKRVWLGEVPGLQSCLEQIVGPVTMFGQGYRLNYDGELPNASIHSDLGWGTHALVVYLCSGEGGTAFWRHKRTGAETITVGETDLLEEVSPDWNDESKWTQVDICPLQYGRAVIYDGSHFHSRYPFAAFGDCPENGRLVAVAFFSMKNDPSSH